MKRASTSDRTTRWVLAVAGGAAFVGALMKLSDFLAPPPIHTASAVSDERPGREDGARLKGPAEHDRQARSFTPSDAPRAEPLDNGRRDRGGPPSDGPAPDRARPRLTPLERREQAHERRAARRAARERARDAGQEPSPSLDARAAGGGSPTQLASNQPKDRPGAAVPVPSPNDPSARTGAPEPSAPPAPSDVAFDSGDAGQYTTADPVLVEDLPHIAGASGTLSFWIQPQWGEGSADDASFLELGDGQLRVVKNVSFLRFEWGNEGAISGIGVPISDWKAGDWHAVTTTWNGNSYALYVDGQLVSSKVDVGRVNLPPDTTLTIGSNWPESRPIAPGMIARVDVRNRPLGPGEVAGAYKAVVGH